MFRPPLPHQRSHCSQDCVEVANSVAILAQAFFGAPHRQFGRGPSRLETMADDFDICSSGNLLAELVEQQRRLTIGEAPQGRAAVPARGAKLLSIKVCPCCEKPAKPSKKHCDEHNQDTLCKKVVLGNLASNRSSDIYVCGLNFGSDGAGSFLDACPHVAWGLGGGPPIAKATKVTTHALPGAGQRPSSSHLQQHPR